MKYLDMLTKLKEAGQNAERCKRELANIAESGKPQFHKTANLKADYMRAEASRWLPSSKARCHRYR